VTQGGSARQRIVGIIGASTPPKNSTASSNGLYLYLPAKAQIERLISANESSESHN